jgi:predicted RNA-binding Zn-ribbon protein involved in translation (DUF1610 family)
MAKFSVEVVLVARCTYTVEVEAESERKAEDLAASRDIAIANTPDFDVDLGDCSYEFPDTNQLSYDCEECGAEDITTSHTDWLAHGYMCSTCFVKAQEADHATV